MPLRVWIASHVKRYWVMSNGVGVFKRYVTVGVLNTFSHWTVFLILHYMFFISQAISNFISFCLAVTLSFFLHAKYTFEKSPTERRYGLFVVFMAGLSLLIGKLADFLELYPMATLIISSGVSLVVGFVYSNKIVFK